ncbi:MAG TPA: hypothetical protein PLD54_02545 [Candidatus Levybacteria bacterium]|nr:hypothetical protein [Candidatus Levybacteria bacterium]
MKLFSIGFGVTLAFLIVIAIFALHIAYFPAPKAPKAPEYPGSSTMPFSMGQMMPVQGQAAPYTMSVAPQPVTLPMPAQEIPGVGSTGSAVFPPEATMNVQQTFPDSNDYSSDYEQYQQKQEQYKKDSAAFMKDEMVPYIKNMIIRHLIILVSLEVLAIFFVRFISVTVGGAYAFGGLLGVIGGVFGSVFIVPYTLVSSFASAALGQDQSELFDATSFFAGIGWTAVVGVLILTVLTVLLVDGMLRFNMRSSSPLPPEAR